MTKGQFLEGVASETALRGGQVPVGGRWQEEAGLCGRWRPWARSSAPRLAGEALLQLLAGASPTPPDVSAPPSGRCGQGRVLGRGTWRDGRIGVGAVGELLGVTAPV